MTSRAGVALLFVSGLLALLLLLSGSFIAATRLAATATLSSVDGAVCRLASGSGMDYAAARLMENPFPGPAPSAARRGDDWSGLPAYARGEPWTDDPSHAIDGIDNDGNDRVDEPFEGDGVREPGEPWGPDRDGDGKFSAWSGRLRGPGFGVPFALRIESAGGKIPVNAGFLDPPRHNAVAPACHAGLARALNNLGAILFAATPDRLARVGREDVPTGNAIPGEPIRISRLGEHLLAARPPGGYRSRNEADRALTGAGYLPEERAEILRQIDTGPCDTLMAYPDGGAYRPVELSTASFATLQALWRYLKTASSQPVPTEFLEGPAPPYGNPGARSGGHLAFDRTRGMILYPDEAEGLATFAERFRKGPGASSWPEFRRQMANEAPSIFARDSGLLSAAGQPRAAAVWARMKADLAFFALAPDRPPDRLTSNGATWNLPHPVLGTFHPVFLHRMDTGFQGIAYPRSVPPRWTDPAHPHDSDCGYASPLVSPPQNLWPVGLTLAPPVRFEVAARARAERG